MIGATSRRPYFTPQGHTLYYLLIYDKSGGAPTEMLHRSFLASGQNHFYYLKSETKPFNVLIARTCPLVTEFADKLR